MGLTLLAHTSMSIKYWDHTFNITVYLINGLPTVGLAKFISPYAALYNKQPNSMSLKVYDNSCFPLLNPCNQHKLQFRSSECVYLGMSPTHNGKQYLNVEGRIFISMDVMFNEFEFPFNKLFSSNLDENSKGSAHNHSNVLVVLSGSYSNIESKRHIE